MSSLGSHLRNPNVECNVQSFPSLSREKIGAGCFLWLMCLSEIMVRRCLKVLFVSLFLPALVWLVSHLPDVQESLNWFLDFSQRELVQVLLNWCVCGGEEKSKAFYPAILLMSSPQN